MVSKVFGKGQVERIYYGLNVGRKAEPIDQLDGMLLSRRIGCRILLYIAGRYGILNSRSPNKEDIIKKGQDLAKKENAKADLLRAIGRVFGTDSIVLTTEELWQSEEYWKMALELSSREGIINSCKNGILLEDIPIKAISPTDAFAEFYVRFARIAASSLYTLLEVAEALYLSRKFRINTKIGPSSEERYDLFIGEFMNIIQVSQPLGLGSNRKSPQPVIPYIGKGGEVRISFEDSKEQIDEKVFKCAQRNVDSPPYWQLEGTDVPNPFVRLALIGLLSSEALGNMPVRLNSAKLMSADGLLPLAERTEGRDYLRWAGVVSEILWNVIERVNSELERVEVAA